MPRWSVKKSSSIRRFPAPAKSPSGSDVPSNSPPNPPLRPASGAFSRPGFPIPKGSSRELQARFPDRLPGDGPFDALGPRRRQHRAPAMAKSGHPRLRGKSRGIAAYGYLGSGPFGGPAGPAAAASRTEVGASGERGFRNGPTRLRAARSGRRNRRRAIRRRAGAALRRRAATRCGRIPIRRSDSAPFRPGVRSGCATPRARGCRDARTTRATRHRAPRRAPRRGGPGRQATCTVW